MAQFDMKDQIELFIQGEGIPSITLIHVNLWDTVSDIVEAARKHGLSSPEGYEVFVLIEDSDVPLILDAKIEDTSLAMRSRVHIHRLKQVDVVVNFNATS